MPAPTDPIVTITLPQDKGCLKFGDVIEFPFVIWTGVAMVIASEGDPIYTDEGTGALGAIDGDNGIVILGLSPSQVDYPYHQQYRTAELSRCEVRILEYGQDPPVLGHDR